MHAALFLEPSLEPSLARTADEYMQSGRCLGLVLAHPFQSAEGRGGLASAFVLPWHQDSNRQRLLVEGKAWRWMSTPCLYTVPPLHLAKPEAKMQRPWIFH